MDTSAQDQTSVRWLEYMKQWDVYEAFRKQLQPYQREWLEVVEVVGKHIDNTVGLERVVFCPPDILPSSVSKNRLLPKGFVVRTTMPESSTNVTVKGVASLVVIPAYTENLIDDDLDELRQVAVTLLGSLSIGGRFICKLPEHPLDERELQRWIAKHDKMFTSSTVYTPTIAFPAVADTCRFFIGNNYNPNPSLSSVSDAEIRTRYQLFVDHQAFVNKQKLADFTNGPLHPRAKSFVDGAAEWWVAKLHEA